MHAIQSICRQNNAILCDSLQTSSQKARFLSPVISIWIWQMVNRETSGGLEGRRLVFPSQSFFLLLAGCVYAALWWMESSHLRPTSFSIQPASFTFPLPSPSGSALCPPALFRKFQHVHPANICMDQLLRNVDNTSPCRSVTLSEMDKSMLCFSHFSTSSGCRSLDPGKVGRLLKDFPAVA